MKIQPDKSTVQSITGYGPGWISVAGERIHSSVVVSATGLRLPWECHGFSDLTAGHFSMLADMEAELVIFGSGNKMRFPAPAWLAPLMARRIGLETMDTQAACRTYNILAGEGRLVVAALVIEDGTQ